MPPARSISALAVLELVHRAGDEDRDPAGRGDLVRRGEADAARGARDDHGLAVDRVLEGAVLEEVGVEVALPVVPQLVGVGLERRQLDARAVQRALGVARVEGRLEADVLDDRVRDAEVGEQRAADVLERRQLHGVGQHALRQHVGHLLVDADDHLRRVAGLGEGVDDVARARHLRVDEVEGLAVEVGQVRDVVHRRRDVVDGHDVRLADLDADEREPLRQRVARLLDRLEEVVRPVDLVHLAGLGVADDDRGPVHAPRHRRAAGARASRPRTWSGGTGG